MIHDLFKVYAYEYKVDNWDEKKKQLLNVIDFNNLTRNPMQNFSSDRNSDSSYVDDFKKIFKDELEAFKQELEVTGFEVTDVWTVKYRRGDFHVPHNHSGNGFSGIVYLDFDPKEHTTTYFVNPINDPVTDQTRIMESPGLEGMMLIVPSCIMHYTIPNNSNVPRTIVSFDIKF